MTKSTKELIVRVLGVAGVISLLLGLLAETYEFMLGLMIAMGIWLVSGLLARFWAPEEEARAGLTSSGLKSVPLRRLLLRRPRGHSFGGGLGR